METNGKVGVEVTEDGSGSKATFEFLEGFLSLGGPMEVLVFAKSGDGAGNAGISLDKRFKAACSLASASQSGVCIPTAFPSSNFLTRLFRFIFSLSCVAYLTRCLKLLSFLRCFFWSSEQVPRPSIHGHNPTFRDAVPQGLIMVISIRRSEESRQVSFRRSLRSPQQQLPRSQWNQQSLQQQN